MAPTLLGPVSIPDAVLSGGVLFLGVGLGSRENLILTTVPSCARQAMNLANTLAI